MEALLLAAPSLPDSWGALLPHTPTGLLPGHLGRLQMSETPGLKLRAFASSTGTCEQCAFKTSRRAVVSPSLLLIVACFQPCFPVTFAGCEREQRCRSPSVCPRVPSAGRAALRPAPAGDGAAPGTAEPRAPSPACLSLAHAAGLVASLVLVSCPLSFSSPGRGLQPRGLTSGRPTLAGAPA